MALNTCMQFLGCPDCQQALAARARVLSDGFWVNAWYVALPFAATIPIVRWIVRRVDGGRDA